MTIILGIDPGLQHTGWGIINSIGNKLEYIASGVVSPPKDSDIALRLNVIAKEISSYIELYKPEEAAIEETFINENAMSSLKLGHVRGAIMVTIGSFNIPIAEYATRLVKKAITGQGKADKDQVKHMVKLLLPTADPKRHDASDALAIAICHAHIRVYNKKLQTY